MNEVTPGTRQRILEAAERLFAEHGFAGTSLRAIIREAGVNLAAVHYHFGSKEALLEAVVARHFGPLNEERLRALDQVEREAGRRRPSARGIIEAFVGPVLRLCADPARGKTFMKLIGRALAEPEQYFHQVGPKQIGEVRDRFLAAMERALPEVPREEIMWRVLFTIGALAFTMRLGEGLRSMTGGICEVGTVDDHLRRLVEFAAAGLEAPVEGSKS